MEKLYKITIPKPCHEDWNKMTPNNKGKFCILCTKTVINFTNKSTLEIQNIILANKGKRVCGHFYKKQLDTVNIEIPNFIIKKQFSHARVFALALLITMGTTLMSCKTDGKIKKIESVEVVESVDSLETDSVKATKSVKSTKHIKKQDSTQIIKVSKLKTTLGMVLTPTKPIVKDVSEKFIEPEELTIEGEIVIDEYIDDSIINFVSVEEKPRFKIQKINTPEKFNKLINKFVKDNFDLDLSPDYNLPKGRNRIYVQFIIDKIGNIKDVKVRAPHKILEKNTIKMFEKLPQFIPAKHKGRAVDVKYILPINFNVE